MSNEQHSTKDIEDKVEGLAVAVEGIIGALKRNPSFDTAYLEMLLISALKGLAQPYEGKVEKPKMVEVLERLKRSASVPASEASQ